jgi:hypothetical protein
VGWGICGFEFSAVGIEYGGVFDLGFCIDFLFLETGPISGLPVTLVNLLRSLLVVHLSGIYSCQHYLFLFFIEGGGVLSFLDTSRFPVFFLVVSRWHQPDWILLMRRYMHY